MKSSSKLLFWNEIFFETSIPKWNLLQNFQTSSVTELSLTPSVACCFVLWNVFSVLLYLFCNHRISNQFIVWPWEFVSELDLVTWEINVWLVLLITTYLSLWFKSWSCFFVFALSNRFHQFCFSLSSTNVFNISWNEPIRFSVWIAKCSSLANSDFIGFDSCSHLFQCICVMKKAI